MSNRTNTTPGRKVLPTRVNSSQENKISDIDKGNCPTRRGGLIESIKILSVEMNANLSQEIVSLMSMMQTQVIITAKIDKVIQKYI